MSKNALIYFMIIGIFIAVPILANAENFFSISLENRKTGFTNKILVREKAKNRWEAQRIFNGKIERTKELKEEDYHEIRIAVIVFMESAKSEKVAPECPEIFSVEMKEGNPPSKRFVGCAVAHKKLEHLFLKFLRPFYPRQSGKK